MNLTLTILLTFAVLMPLIWCGVLALTARSGGWSQLAENFRDDSEPVGEKISWGSAKVGWANYNNCLTLHVSPEGLWMAIFPVFRIAHPQLFIPWEAFHDIGERRLFGVFPYLETWVGAEPAVSVKFPRNTGKHLTQYLG